MSASAGGTLRRPTSGPLSGPLRGPSSGPVPSHKPKRTVFKDTVKFIFIENFSKPMEDEHMTLYKRSVRSVPAAATAEEGAEGSTEGSTGAASTAPAGQFYQVKFKPTSRNINNSKKFRCDSMDDFFSYLGLICSLLVADRSPFHGVQVFVPGFPSIMFDPTDLGSLPTQELLRAALEHWAETPNLVNKYDSSSEEDIDES